MIKKNFKLFFRTLLSKFGQVNTDKAVLVYDGDGELTEGMEVYIESDSEDNIEYVVPEDGEYTMENGDVIVVADGKVSEIRKAEEGESEEAPAEEPAEENMEGEGGASEAGLDAAPGSVEDIVAPEEPAFDAEEACRMLAEEVAAMKAEIQALRDQVNSLLEVPVEEDAFSKQKKIVKSDFKALMKCK